ncbi:zinc ribbon domain-containing protein [Candidatus Woesearchaeota archaeon]|jgi:RNA polymerase subunit RPABC4/transcription elongation factor Spt4|nr:zinc ribbon domain-containing protein [Candidatus Woesearchaeota archaeon]MBT6044544.1 zinc ribbon domain-containing protein [Candidatus Woesearchaeota archaeon]
MATKKRATRKKCSNCHKLTSTEHKFCQHCGHNLTPHKKRGVHKCPNCKGVIEGHSRYCKHCGTSIDTYAHHAFVRLLMFFIVFLVVAFALLIFFSPALVDYGGEQVTVSETKDPFLRMGNAVCTWKDDSFNLCTNVNWDGNENDYVKCSFSGNIDEKSWTSSPLTCCGDVGTDEGIKLARSFLFDEGGNTYEDEGVSVSCSGKPSSFGSNQFLPKPLEEYEMSYWFTAKSASTSGKGRGTEYINFPSRVKSCEYTGRWITTRDISSDFCIGAEGVFSGYADLFEQTVYSDPGTFRWEGVSENLLNPEGVVYENYAVYSSLCSPDFGITPKYYVRGNLGSVNSTTGFGTDQLALSWDYYSNFPRPGVNIFLDLNCTLY